MMAAAVMLLQKWALSKSTDRLPLGQTYLRRLMKGTLSR